MVVLMSPIGRLLKHLAAMGSIYETGPNEYVPTPFSKALQEPIYRDAYPTMYCFSKCNSVTRQLTMWLGLISAVPDFSHFRTISPKPNTRIPTTL